MLVTLAHITGINAVFGQSLGASWVVGEQAMPVVVKISDQGHINAHPVKLFANVRHSLGRLWRVDCDSHHFRPGDGECFHLDRSTDGVNRIGISHRLNSHRRVSTHCDNP